MHLLNPNCFLLQEFQFTDTIPGDINTVSVNVYTCNGSYLNFNEFSGIYTVNECIDISTIDISSSIGTINSTYTLVQVQNAIISSSGNINRIITDGVDIIGNLRLKFSDCI